MKIIRIFWLKEIIVRKITLTIALFTLLFLVLGEKTEAGIKPCSGVLTATFKNGSCSVTCSSGVAFSYCDKNGSPYCGSANNIGTRYVSSTSDFLDNNIIKFRTSIPAQTINLKNKGRYYTFTIEIPTKIIDLTTINLSTIKLYNMFEPIVPPEIVKFGEDCLSRLIVKFDAGKIDLEGSINADHLAIPADITFFITGHFNDGNTFIIMEDARVVSENLEDSSTLVKPPEGSVVEVIEPADKTVSNAQEKLNKK